MEDLVVGFGEGKKTFVGFVKSSDHLWGGLKPRDKNLTLEMLSSPFSFWLLLMFCLYFWSKLHAFLHCWQVTEKKLKLSGYIKVKMWFMKHECDGNLFHL